MAYIIYWASFTKKFPYRAGLFAEIAPHSRLVIKAYIGHTGGTLENRRGEHEEIAIKNGPVNCPAFHNALRAHGIKNFLWKRIDTATDRREAIQKEGNAILQYGTLVTPDRDGREGYNIRLPHPDDPEPGDPLKPSAQAGASRRNQK